MYPYTAGATALASGFRRGLQMRSPELLERLKDPAVRARIKKELAGDHPDWENLFYDCGGPAGVLIASAENPDLKQFGGKNSRRRGKGVEEISGRHADGFRHR